MKRPLTGFWILTVSLGCSRPSPRDAAPAYSNFSEYRGKVVITGSEQSTSVRLVGDSGNVEVVGALESELRRLSGAGLVARGSLQGSRPVQTLEVSDYDIADIDGEVPTTGILKTENGRTLLVGKDTLELVDPPDALVTKTGGKAWVVGPRSGGRLTVQSFGIIRDPSPSQ
jgi:hypothetical protein